MWGQCCLHLYMASLLVSHVYLQCLGHSLVPKEAHGVLLLCPVSCAEKVMVRHGSHINACAQTSTSIIAHVCGHTYMHTCMHQRMHECERSRILIHTDEHAQVLAHAHQCTPACPHQRILIHTDEHTQVLPPAHWPPTSAVCDGGLRIGRELEREKERETERERERERGRERREKGREVKPYCGASGQVMDWERTVRMDIRDRKQRGSPRRKGEMGR